MIKEGLLVEPNIDNTDYYLDSGTRTPIPISEFSSDEINTLKKNLTDGQIVRKIIYWMQQKTERLTNGSDKRKFKRSSKEILESGERTGCCDSCTLFTSLAREFGIPTMQIITLRKDWGKNTDEGLEPETAGHYFAAVYLKDNKGKDSWYLIDPDRNVSAPDKVEFRPLSISDRHIGKEYYSFAYVKDYYDDLGIDSIAKMADIQLSAYKICDKNDIFDDKKEAIKENFEMSTEKVHKPLGHSYEKIREVLKKILSVEELRDKLIISGGIVPWIVSNTDSDRLHSDIDIICKQEDMEMVRNKLKEFGVYNELMDSLYYNHDDNLDYGVDTNISGVPVGFYPYDVKTVKKLDDNGKFVDTDMIVQRSFTPPFVNGKLSGNKEDRPELKVKDMPSLLESDYYSKASIDGIPFKHTSLELIKATKQRAMKASWRSGKDLKDIEQIDKIGIDSEKQARINMAMTLMRSTLDDNPKRNKDLNKDVEINEK